MPNPVGTRHHPLAAASTPPTAPLPTILSEAYFSFYLFSSLPSSFFLHSTPCPSPSSSLTLSLSFPNSTERQHIKTGGGDRLPEKGLRNADTAFPRLSGPLPFDASVFFSFYNVERFDACLVVVILVEPSTLLISFFCTIVLLIRA